MSSTTDRPAHGQALAIFALSLTAVLLAAALAFDGGLVFVERRDQQNAADAAALAGARFLTASTSTARLRAKDAAEKIAEANGFEDGSDSASVRVHIPPVTGPHMGQSGYIEVQISSTRPSIFAGVAGIVDWDVGARAVALNGDGAGGDFAILALDPAGCNAFKVTGSGSAKALGDIQVNSTCPAGAMTSGGGGTIEVIDLDSSGYACNVVGPPPNSIDIDGGGTIVCTKNMGAVPIVDPLKDLPAPARPELAAPPVKLVPTSGGPGIPRGCPGDTQNPPSWTSPEKCAFQGNSYRPTTWRLYPGLYPGGLNLSDGTFYFTPGIYYVAGGGINVGGGFATARTLDASGNLVSDGVDPSVEYGVMFFNTTHPAGGQYQWGPTVFNGGFADFELLPLNLPTSDPDSSYNGIIVFNDRNFPTSPTATSIRLNGGGSNFIARGTFYTPSGLMTVEGNSSVYEFTMDQAIAYNYVLTGKGGSIVALNDADFIFKLRAAGLVE